MSIPRLSYLPILCAVFSLGCVPIAHKQSVGDGFYIKTIDYFLSPEQGGGRELHYKDRSGRSKLVWKNVPEPYRILIHDETAVFIGDWDGGGKPSGYAYFAARDGGPVVHIGQAVLRRAAQKSAANPVEYFERYGEYKLEAASTGGVQFEFSANQGVNKQHLLVALSWEEISEIVDSVAKAGKPNKDRLSGLTYFE